MNRRHFLALSGTATLGVIAGCSSGDANGSVSDSAGSPTTDEATGTTPTAAAETTAAAGAGSGSSAGGFSNVQVAIETDARWRADIRGSEATVVKGTGSKVVDVDTGDADVVSAAVQKQVDTDESLVVEILDDGDVVKRSSTSAPNGLVVLSVTSDEIGSAPAGSGSHFSVHVTYDGSWAGAVGQPGSMQSVSGSGSKTIDVDGSPEIVATTVHKTDDSTGELTVQIVEDGSVVKEASTTSSESVTVTFSSR